MKTDIITIDNLSMGFDAAVEQTRSAALYRGMSHAETLQLQLLTEEMLSMAHSITGELRADFWLESENRRFSLCMATTTVMDKDKRKLLISASSDRKNAAANSFLGKLRDALEELMAAEPIGGSYDIPIEVQADLAGHDYDSSVWDWDGYERSVLYRLADSVRVSIRGNHIEIVVTKDFG